MLDFMISPGSVIGCTFGLLAAVALHWFFPEQDLKWAQALLIALCCILGMVFEHAPSAGRPGKD